MHFLVNSSYQRILVNLIVKIHSKNISLLLKFENVANTDFLATPFLAAATVGISGKSLSIPIGYILMFGF